MSPMDILVVALLGGALSLDAVSVTQTMVSRPIVASTLVALVLGSPESGLMIGAILELLAVETMPFGASRYLEWSCGAVVAAVFVTTSGRITGSVLIVAMIFALLSAWLAGTSMVYLRQINGQLAAGRRASLERGDATALPVLQASGIALDFVRGCVVVVVATLITLPTGRLLVNAMGVSDALNRSFVFAVPAAVALAACWRIFTTSGRRYLILAGAVVGMALVASR